jgi:predicted CoA-binding protein
MPDWKKNLLEDDASIRELLRASKRVAVLGIKTAEQSAQPAYYVPKFVAAQGAEVIPVPVYYPDVEEILGKKVYRKLADVPGPIDLVDVFRRPGDIPPHLGDLRAKKPRGVWFQLGIRNDAAAEALAKDGIQVVQDRCLMVEWRRLLG